ncbi:hypothetical protein EJB05_35205, partial [Eragrostis curvula]
MEADVLPTDSSIADKHSWLATYIPFVLDASKNFSSNPIHLTVRDIFHSLQADGSDAVAKAISDHFSFVSTDQTSKTLLEALQKFSLHINDAVWGSAFDIGKKPTSTDLLINDDFTVDPSLFLGSFPVFGQLL